jgi:hypothetical protein
MLAMIASLHAWVVSVEQYIKIQAHPGVTLLLKLDKGHIQAN